MGSFSEAKWHMFDLIDELLTKSSQNRVFLKCVGKVCKTQLTVKKEVPETRPAGLEPATYGLEIRLWRCKSRYDKHLHCVFEQKMRITSHRQVNNKW